MILRSGLVALVLIMTITRAYALDIVLADGTQYSNIRLKEKSDLGIRVAHTSGVTFIDYLSLAPKDQYVFGYDEGKYRVQRGAFSSAPAPVATAQPATYDAKFLPKYAAAPAATPYSNPPAQYSSPPPQFGASRNPSQATGQCAAVTKKGYQCSRRAAVGSSYCWQHGR